MDLSSNIPFASHLDNHNWSRFLISSTIAIRGSIWYSLKFFFIASRIFFRSHKLIAFFQLIALFSWEWEKYLESWYDLKTIYWDTWDTLTENNFTFYFKWRVFLLRMINFKVPASSIHHHLCYFSSFLVSLQLASSRRRPSSHQHLPSSSFSPLA